MSRLPVRDVMGGPAVTTTGEATTREAAATMRSKNVGSLVITDGPRPVGIVTERDIVRKVVAGGGDLAAPVRNIMSHPILSVDPNTDVADAARLMAMNRVRRLPIMDGSGLVGIITDRDILAISPALMDLWREQDQPTEAEAAPGVCEGCGALAEGLRADNGQHLCEDCIEDVS